MRYLLHRLIHRFRLWMVRTWTDPHLALMAERYGAVIVTAERHGRIVMPIYRVSGEETGRLVASLHSLANERDYWKRIAQRSSGAAPLPENEEKK